MNLIDYMVLEVTQEPFDTGHNNMWCVGCKTVDMGGEQEGPIYGSYFFCTCVVKKGYRGLH